MEKTKVNDFSFPYKQGGVALLIVIASFAILMVVVSQIILSSQSILDRRRTLMEYQQALLLCLSGEEVARQLLYEDFQNGPEADYYAEDWAKPGLRHAVDGGYYEISIRDAQGRFNVNSFSSGMADGELYRLAFQNLLMLTLDDSNLSTKLSFQLVDWVDSDKSGDFEEGSYIATGLPYIPSNRQMLDPTEIRLLRDMSQETYHQLRPLIEDEISALPSGTKVNINTVTAGTLSALAGIDIKDARERVEQIYSAREGYRRPADALSGINPLNLSFYDVKSSYFEVRVRARFGERYAYLTSLLFRDPANNGRLNIIRRDFSKIFIFEFSEDYNANDSDRFEIDI